MSRSRVVVIGAGPAGLTAAHELAQAGVRDIVVLEASTVVGGLAQSIDFKGNRIDIGGHRFFSKSDWVMDWWLRMLPLAAPASEAPRIAYQGKWRPLAARATASESDPNVMLVRERLSRIYFAGQLFDYPLKANLETAAFDPAALAVTGPVRSLTQGSRSLTYGKAAPDGRWIVFRTLEPQEDLFVIRPDGSDHRQITQDSHRDRGPVWLPDGRILFFSDRGGRFGIWSIRPDGSELLPLATPANGALYQPIPSPDGRRIVCNRDFRTAVLVDLDKPLEQRVPRPLPIRDPEKRLFFASSWSRDGRWLAGGIEGRGAAIYSLETGTYAAILEGGIKPVWLPDSQTILYVREGKIFGYDMRSRAERVVLEPPGGSSYTGVDVSSDGRTLYLLRDAEEADVWLLTMPEEGA